MTDVFKLIEEHGLTLHGDIEHFAELIRTEKQEPYGYFRYDIQLDAWVQNKEGTQGVAFYTAPVHASDISQERVDETAKDRHEPVAWHEPGAYGNVTTHKDWALANGWLPLYKERT